MALKQRPRATVLSRRSLLAVAPAVALAGAVPAVAARPGETPVIARFRRWESYHRWLNGPGTDGMPDEEFADACEAGSRMVREILELPSEDACDVLAKVMAVTEWGGELFLSAHGDCTLIGAEARDLLDGGPHAAGVIL